MTATGAISLKVAWK